MRVEDYATLGGYTQEIKSVDQLSRERVRTVGKNENQADPMHPANFSWAKGRA